MDSAFEKDPHRDDSGRSLTIHAGDGTTILQIHAALCTDASSHATSDWPAQDRDRLRQSYKAMLVDLAVLHSDRAELAIGQRRNRIGTGRRRDGSAFGRRKSTQTSRP
jgi:hypothetical protein